MNSPDDFKDLERRLRQALRSHGDLVEPSVDAYARLTQAVDEAPMRSRLGRVRAVLGSTRPGRALPLATDSLRPMVFVTAVLAVAGLGAYTLLDRSSSPTETATAAPANADASELVPGANESAAEDDAVDTNRGDGDEAETDTALSDSVDGSPRPSVPSEAESGGSATQEATNPVERFAGLTYAPVRVTAVEAAQAFMDLLAIEGVTLEERSGEVVVRAADSTADNSTESRVLTTLTIGEQGAGFMVIDARSDQLDVAVENVTPDDPTGDEIVDAAAVTGPVEITGRTSIVGGDVKVAVRSVIDGSVLAESVVEHGSIAEAEGGYRSTLSLIGSERVWVVATAVDPVDGSRSLAARSVLYTGQPDPLSYTVVGLPPDDADGGLVVRATPGGEQTGVIALGTTGVRRVAVPPRLVGDLVWWAVEDPTGLNGWVAAPYLAVDHEPTETTLVELARAVMAAASSDTTEAAEAIALSKPFYIGPIVEPRRISGLSDLAAMLTTKRRLISGAGGSTTAAEYYGFDRWLDAEVFVPKGYRQDGAAVGARAFFGDLPSVVIRSLNPETGGWERVHLFVSRSSDEPILVAMVLEREPLPESAEGDEPPAGESPESDG